MRPLTRIRPHLDPRDCMMRRSWLLCLAPVFAGNLYGMPITAHENEMVLDLPQEQIRDTENVTIGEIFYLNDQIREIVTKLATSPYFSSYKVDLSGRQCPFGDDEALCVNNNCAVSPMDSSQMPDIPQFLGRLRANSVSSDPPEYENVHEGDYCYPEDESMASDGVWVDLNDNIERYTGYTGDSARNMWAMVYMENCFGYSGADFEDLPETNFRQQPSIPGLGIGAASELVSAPECVEQRLFYKMISGMHASISTHLSYEWYNATTQRWGPNPFEFFRRVGWFEDRLNHLFLNYVLVSRAVDKLSAFNDYLVFASPNSPAADSHVRKGLLALASVVRKNSRRGINENGLFQGPETEALKEEFRRRMRNVNALMSCVGCERCRLWGKIQTAGYGTALKILLELPEKPQDDMERTTRVLGDFRRSELVALVQTLSRLSHSVEAVSKFRRFAEVKLLDKSRLRQEWEQTWEEAKMHLKFIFRSYIDLPRNLLHLILFYVNYGWSSFITGGRVETEIRDL